MDRSSFIKLFGLGAVATVAPKPKDGELPREKIKTKQEGKDYEELYQVFKEGKPVKIGGMEFHMIDMNIEHHPIHAGRGDDAVVLEGRKNITITLQT